jgi:hypothetical protein
MSSHSEQVKSLRPSPADFSCRSVSTADLGVDPGPRRYLRSYLRGTGDATRRVATDYGLECLPRGDRSGATQAVEARKTGRKAPGGDWAARPHQPRGRSRSVPRESLGSGSPPSLTETIDRIQVSGFPSLREGVTVFVTVHGSSLYACGPPVGGAKKE